MVKGGINMGTSQSSLGPGSNSPLVPPWADDHVEPTPENNDSVPQPEAHRFRTFRQSIGKFIRSGDYSDLESALGDYSRKSTGGGKTAVLRMGNVIHGGSTLYRALSGNDKTAINLNSLSGTSCESAINLIVQSLSVVGGDADTIRVAMNAALVEALDGVRVFEPSVITDDVIVNTMINYISENILLRIVMDAGKAWTHAETPQQQINAENTLRELIKVVVDKKMAPMFNDNMRSLTYSEIQKLQQDTFFEVWQIWEAY